MNFNYYKSVVQSFTKVSNGNFCDNKFSYELQGARVYKLIQKLAFQGLRVIY